MILPSRRGHAGSLSRDDDGYVRGTVCSARFLVVFKTSSLRSETVSQISSATASAKGPFGHTLTPLSFECQTERT
jgi:hypothetical protein